MRKFLYKNFVLVFSADILLIIFAWFLAYLLRFNFDVPSESYATLKRSLPFILVLKILIFYYFDLYEGMWRYTSLNDLLSTIKASTISSLVLVMLVLFLHGFAGFSRSIFIIDWFLTILFISGTRLGIRVYFWLSTENKTFQTQMKALLEIFTQRRGTGQRLLIIGAGDFGEKIYREIRDNPELGYEIVGFIDDDPLKTDLKIHGVPVLGSISQIQNIARKMEIEALLIAVPSASRVNMRAVVEACEKTGLPFKTVPSMSELIDGRVTVKAIRDVAYEDLLGREPVNLDNKSIGEYINGKCVLVTGGGGSIGSELCRQICRYKPGRLILFERAESPLYEIELELKENFPSIEIIPRLGDILDRNKLKVTFDRDCPSVVFHSAAYKHVPMLELQPWEAVGNDILGTRNVVDQARESKVEEFVFVSTDKAVRPVNVMGASKRVAELLVQAQNGCALSTSKFLTVRFGNVVGSVGSVVPLFKKQIEKGGPLTVTHPEITRYFMTIPEACQLILQAGTMGDGGEIFILDMGVPVRIDDMARDLIKLSGFEPDVDIKIEYTGLRPGEKLKEELITEGEGIVQTSHEKIMVVKGPVCEINALNGNIDELVALTVSEDGDGIKKVLKKILPEYEPQGVSEY